MISRLAISNLDPRISISRSSERDQIRAKQELTGKKSR